MNAHGVEPDMKMATTEAATCFSCKLETVPKAGAGSAPSPAPLADPTAGRCEIGDAAALAAAPTFAAMALFTGLSKGNPADMLCLAAQDASPLAGMAFMYVLMSVFHTRPWLKLISSWRRAAA